MKQKSLRDMLNQKNVLPENLTPEQQKQFGQMRSVYDQYKDKSAPEIVGDIDRMKNSREIRQFIQSGQLDEFARTIRPMLGGNAAKLDEVMRHLKK